MDHGQPLTLPSMRQVGGDQLGIDPSAQTRGEPFCVPKSTRYNHFLPALPPLSAPPFCRRSVLPLVCLSSAPALPQSRPNVHPDL
eukprot:1178228-Prorocentrum_minimum.AAC.11